jgi:protein-tyrosine phosphatase
MYNQLNLACTGKVFFGRVPDQETFLFLKEQQVSGIWNLMDELKYIFVEEQNKFKFVINTPIKDLSIPEGKLKDFFLRDLNFVQRLLKSGINVFVHCLGGHGRTGMALASLLITINHLSIEQALQFTHEICQGPELEIQKDFIRKIFSFKGDYHA